MSDPKAIAYRYVGPARFPGVPPHDLTNERVARLSLKLQAALDQDNSPYRKVAAKEAKGKGKEA